MTVVKSGPTHSNVLQDQLQKSRYGLTWGDFSFGTVTLGGKIRLDMILLATAARSEPFFAFFSKAINAFVVEVVDANIAV